MQQNQDCRQCLKFFGNDIPESLQKRGSQRVNRDGMLTTSATAHNIQAAWSDP